MAVRYVSKLLKRRAFRSEEYWPKPLFLGSEIYRRSTYGSRHPLAIPRVSTAIDLCRALGWLPEESYLDSPRATPLELARFHAPDYVAAVQRAERDSALPEEERRRYNLGINGNPIFPEIFSRPATACGASLLAARLLRDGGTVYSPAGGTHHGRPDRASGFCYFNDPVLALLAFLDQGLERLVYLDLDAHHGDGVQDAFHDDPRVLTISIHEEGRWPMSAGSGKGGTDDRAGGAACNLPVPPGFNDSELAYLLAEAVFPLIEKKRPQALVIQCGADALADDPMSGLALSNRALWRAVAGAKGLAPRLLVLGGGGYNPWSVGRCWAGIWATLAGREIPERLPAPAQALLRGLTWRHRLGRNPSDRWMTRLADRPNGGPVRRAIRDLAEKAPRI